MRGLLAKYGPAPSADEKSLPLMPRLADQESGCAGFGGTPGPEEGLVITDRLYLGWVSQTDATLSNWLS